MNKQILIAPLNWGLGHAARCIPIINALLFHGFQPIIGGDGSALSLLKKEFPKLECIELPSYNINYTKNGSYIKLKLLKKVPKILKAINAEHKLVQDLINQNKIHGIISDNRFGVHSKKVPSVYITHQLNVLSGNTTLLSTKVHQKIIKKFDECWIPDYEGTNNLSGDLGHSKSSAIKTTYIGPLSRFNKQDVPKKYDLMVLLSGPEPQRSLLEAKLFDELRHYEGKVVFIKGQIESEQKITVNNNMSVYNFMTSTELEKTINESELIVSRSGYTTIMDLAKLGKRAFFIPTPGQDEQEYLAEKLEKDNRVPFCNQDEFSMEKLKDISNYKGFSTYANEPNFKNLLSLFERE